MWWLLFAALFGCYGIYDAVVSNHPTWFFWPLRLWRS